MILETVWLIIVFLSTLSLRRATNSGTQADPAKSISIHALLAESDVRVYELVWGVSISIHALLAESDEQAPCRVAETQISIHALLAESD